jgi:hypothetical protein
MPGPVPPPERPLGAGARARLVVGGLPRARQELRKRHGGAGVISTGDARSKKLRGLCQFVIGDGVAVERRCDDDLAIDDFDVNATPRVSHRVTLARLSVPPRSPTADGTAGLLPAGGWRMQAEQTNDKHHLLNPR